MTTCLRSSALSTSFDHTPHARTDSQIDTRADGAVEGALRATRSMAIRLAASGDKAQQLRIFFFLLLFSPSRLLGVLLSGLWCELVDGIGERNEIAVDFIGGRDRGFTNGRVIKTVALTGADACLRSCFSFLPLSPDASGSRVRLSASAVDAALAAVVAPISLRYCSLRWMPPAGRPVQFGDRVFVV